MIYNPLNWYWVVGNSTTQVYSSAVGDFVSVNDPIYQAWLKRNQPTTIDSDANLGQVLAQNNSLRPKPAGILDGYTTAMAGNIVVQAIFKILFNHENRLRAIERNLTLNGSPPALTAQQAVAAVKALM